MKRLFASLLAIAVLATSSAAIAQSGDDPYGNPYNDGVPADIGTVDNGAYANDANVDPGRNSYYDYARVIRVDPVLDDGYAAVPSQTRRCYDRTTAGRYERDPYNDGRGGYYDDRYGRYDRDPYGNDRRPGTHAGGNAAAIIGGIAGAVVGSQIGGGSGTYAATAVGSLLGSVAGREIYEQNQRERYVRGGTVRVCDPEPVRGDGYGDADDRQGSGGYDVTYEYNGRQYTRRMDYNPGDRIRVRVDVAPE